MIQKTTPNTQVINIEHNHVFQSQINYLHLHYTVSSVKYASVSGMCKIAPYDFAETKRIRHISNF